MLQGAGEWVGAQGRDKRLCTFRKVGIQRRWKLAGRHDGYDPRLFSPFLVTETPSVLEMSEGGKMNMASVGFEEECGMGVHSLEETAATGQSGLCKYD